MNRSLPSLPLPPAHSFGTDPISPNASLHEAYDRFFGVERSATQSCVDSSLEAAARASSRLLAATGDVPSWVRSALRAGLSEAARVHGGRSPSEPAAERGELDAPLRWRLGHHLFFVLIQALVRVHGRITPRAGRDDIADELRSAATLFEASRAAIHLAGHMSSEEYAEVRATMQPPNAPPGFSGLNSPDHAALLAAAREAGRVVTGHLDDPEVRAAAETYATALDSLYAEHSWVCDRCVHGGTSLLAAHLGGSARSLSHLEALRVRFRRAAGVSHSELPAAEGMERVPEPELMDDAAQAVAYASADFEEADRRFVDGFLQRFGDDWSGEIVDLGCGPGNIALRLASRLPSCRVWGVDGSEPMLELARERAAEVPPLAARLRWRRALLQSEELPTGPFAAIVSNSLLHHLHDPSVLWSVTEHLGAPGAAVYCGDLRRPASPEQARAIVDRYASDAPEVLREDFFASLRAAFTPEEVRGQLCRAGLGMLEVEAVGDRHLVVWGRLPGTPSR